MIESNSTSIEESGSEELANKGKKVGIRREPSFSGWCDEDGIPRPARMKNEYVNEEDFDFESPLVQPHGLGSAVLEVESFTSSNSWQRMESDGDNDGASLNGLRNQKEYTPFDIENGHDIERCVRCANSLDHVNCKDASRKNAKDLLSVADVLKTLFFILVWYTFSTFLTLWPLPFTVVPTALSTAMDVNLSNASLVFISVTFATMCKSASPIFLLLFAFAFRLESPSIKLLGIITVISVGILLTVAKGAEFEFWGFLFVMLAAVMSGFRWTMTQILLRMKLMVLTEYILVSVTSAVTVTIAGVVKEAVTILVAVLYFHDKFTWLKGIGLLTIMIGVSLFNWHKYSKLHEGEHSSLSPKNGSAPKYVILDEMEEEEDSPLNSVLHPNQ